MAKKEMKENEIIKMLEAEGFMEITEEIKKERWYKIAQEESECFHVSTQTSGKRSPKMSVKKS